MTQTGLAKYLIYLYPNSNPNRYRFYQFCPSRNSLQNLSLTYTRHWISANRHRFQQKPRNSAHIRHGNVTVITVKGFTRFDRHGFYERPYGWMINNMAGLRHSDAYVVLHVSDSCAQLIRTHQQETEVTQRKFVLFIYKEKKEGFRLL